MKNILSTEDVAKFTWNFGQKFLLETSKGNFVWSSPDYGGDNTIRPYLGDPRSFTEPGFCGRYKGQHIISAYCGSEVKIVSE